jgi:hypothetical protein
MDVRWVYAAPWMIDWGRPDVAHHLDPAFGRNPSTHPSTPNLALIFMRQVSTGGGFSHVLVARQPVDNRAMRSSRGIVSFAPLWVDGTANLNTNLDALPEQILGFVYATLWSAEFRRRHADALCRDVPRVPLARYDPAVAAAGRRLMAIHLGEANEGPSDTTPSQLGGTDAASRYKKSRMKRGRAMALDERRAHDKILAATTATQQWILGR